LGGSNFVNFGPDYHQTGELWSTYFDTFGKPFGIATSRPTFVGQCLKTAEISRVGRQVQYAWQKHNHTRMQFECNST